MANYGIPYMGSKSGIVASICANFPAAENFYDLFGGGFSVTHWLLENRPDKYKHFHFNEINPITVELIQKAIRGEFNYGRFKPAWISRQEFHAKKEIDAYIRYCWSFGNNGKDYMFGPDIEAYKRSMHQAVVFGEFDDTAKQIFGFTTWPMEANSIKKRRFWLRQRILFLKTKTNKLKIMKLDQQLQQLQQLQRFQQLEHLIQIQQLHRLEPLGNLQSLERLIFSAKDYREVPILPNSVVYCDIPYKGTAEYGNSFDHKAFFDWASTRDFPVFISEYNISDPRFKKIYEISKRSMLKAVEERTYQGEKLYWNGK